VAILIGGKPLASFDRPLEMLVDCHRRVERFLEQIIKVETLYRYKALDDEAISALKAAQAYFKNSAPKHTEDEEDSLFPRMKLLLREGNPTLRMIHHLESDHRLANELHERVDATLSDWCCSPQGLLEGKQKEQLRQDLHALREHYRDHIRQEEELVFPQAAEVLPEQMISEIGDEMQRRRRG
jgi:hemerythrin-like domain-containing protein